MDLLHRRFEFSGAKIALLCGEQVLTILRDDKPDIPFPNMWDLAGGGREVDETPFECVQREIFEELGITITRDSIIWCKAYHGVVNPQMTSIFMVGHIEQAQIDQIVFGDEGQGYKLMPIKDWLKDETVMPQLRERLGEWVKEIRE